MTKDSSIGAHASTIERIPFVLTIVALALGVAAFFATGGFDRPMQSTLLYESMVIKDAQADGILKLFVLADERYLSSLDAQGRSTPKDDGIVIGAAEAKMMLDEELIRGIGSEIDGFFGIDARVRGILEPTGGPIDDMHLLSSDAFATIDGTDRVHIKILDGMPKLFYRLGVDEQSPLRMSAAEGTLTAYRPVTIDGITYQPLIIGATEAAMMREEGLFTATGDTIGGFFGKEVFIVAVLAPTGTALDMLHITPLAEDAW